MMQIILLFLLCLLPLQSYADTHTAASCSLADVQAAIAAATRGDTVTVPAGSCTWSGTLTITKAIILQGAGKDSSIIKAGFTAPNIDSSNYTNFMLYYNPSSIASDSDVMLRITGFTFDTDYRAAGIYIRNNSLTPLRKLVIDNNYFPNSWDGNVSRWNYISTIRVSGTIYGVIHSNTISGYPKLAFSGMASNAWNYQTYTHGSADTIYFEDNEIISAGQRYEGTTSSSWWNDIGAGATAVYRYNTFHTYRTDNWCDGPNTHGNVQGPIYAGMGSEIYGNYFIHDAGTATAMNPFSQRGGKNLGFYNKVYALGSGGSRLLETEKAGKGADFESPTNHTCPSGTLYAGTKSCASDGQPQHVWRTYIWNNRVGTSGSGSIITHQAWAVTSPEQALRPNVDYFLHNQSFDGSTGVGCGTLANRPSTCTTGVAYWATDQSCTSIANYVGKAPATPISGILYRCGTTDNWQAYYTPYTYPHPLRSDAPADTTDPIISNLCAGAGSCTTPIIEIPCADESEPYTVDVSVGASTNENATVKIDSSAGTDYTSGTWDATMTGGGGTTHTTTLTGLACGASYTRYLKASDTAGNITDADTTLTFTIASKAGAKPTLTDLSGTTQAYNKPGQLLKVHSSVAATCRYTTVGAGTAWADRTAFGITGDTIQHSSSISQAASSTVTYHVLCQDSQGIESDNLAISITTTAGSVITFSGGTSKLNFNDGGNTTIAY